MKIFLVATLFACASSVSAQDRKPSAAETDVLNAANVFYAAFLKSDVDTVSNMTADDYLQTDVNGKIQGKKDWLDEYYLPMASAIKTGKMKLDVFERSDMQVRIYQDTAVLVGRTRMGYNGLPPRDLRFTQVWVKRNGKWLRAVFQNAWLPESTL